MFRYSQGLLCVGALFLSGCDDDDAFYVTEEQLEKLADAKHWKTHRKHQKKSYADGYWANPYYEGYFSQGCPVKSGLHVHTYLAFDDPGNQTPVGKDCQLQCTDDSPVHVPGEPIPAEGACVESKNADGVTKKIGWLTSDHLGSLFSKDLQERGFKWGDDKTKLRDTQGSAGGLQSQNEMEIAKNVAALMETKKDIFLDSKKGFSNLVAFVGQFLAHEIIATDDLPGKCSCDSPAKTCLTVPYLDPNDKDWFQSVCMARPVSNYCIEKEDERTLRYPVNTNVGSLIASSVYGSTAAKLSLLRDGKFLKTQKGPHGLLLPFSNHQAECTESPACKCFEAGDYRNSASAGLSVLHTVFAGVHNYLVFFLAAIFPGVSDEELFQAVRKLVIVFVQILTDKYLETICGTNLLQNHRSPDTDMTALPKEFTAAAFRLHNCVPDNYYSMDVNQGVLNVHETHYSYFNPMTVLQYGVTPFLRGFLERPLRLPHETVISHETTKYMLASLSFGGDRGFNILAATIARGRSQGIMPYDCFRIRFPTEAELAFDANDIPSSTTEVNFDLREDCKGDSVELPPFTGIDAYVGMLLEKPIQGALLGPTQCAVIAQTYQGLIAVTPDHYLKKAETDTKVEILDGKVSVDFNLLNPALLICLHLVQTGNRQEVVAQNPFRLKNKDSNPLFDCCKLVKEFSGKLGFTGHNPYCDGVPEGQAYGSPAGTPY